MKAIILAAGFGNRMRPLTEDTHKALLKVANRTILERIIESLILNDIKDIIIVTGYKSDQIRDFLKDKYLSTNFHYIHNYRWKETNNIFSLSLVFENLNIDEDVLLIESDLLYDPEIIKKLINSKFQNVALVDEYKIGMDGTVVTIKDDIITSVIPPHLQDDKFDFSDKYKTLNIYKFSAEFCRDKFKRLLMHYANTMDHNCYYELILGIIIYLQRENIYVEYVGNNKWAEVDDPNDLNVASFIFDKNSRLDILEKSYGGFWNYDMIDYCYLRNMYFPTGAIFSELVKNLPKLIQNYSSTQKIINKKASYLLLCNEKYLNVLNGLSQIYPILKRRLSNKRVLLPKPTFGEYNRIFSNYSTYEDNFKINQNELDVLSQQNDLIIIINPNNPTGSLINTEWVYNLALRNNKSLFLVDESFIDFSDQPSIINFLEKNPLKNVIVLKSLSKSIGIPGIRLGFIYCQDESFNEILKEEIPIWNLNSIAENFLEVILKHKKDLERSYNLTKKDRNHFFEELKKCKIVSEVFQSSANFLTFKLKDNLFIDKDFSSYLLNNFNIYIHNATKKFNDGKRYYRLAVRNKNENEYLISIFNNYIFKST